MTGIAVSLAGFSVAVACLFVWLQSRGGRGSAVWWIAGVFLSSLLMQQLMLLASGLLFVLALVLPEKTPKKLSLPFALVCTFLPYLLFLATALDQQAQLQELRDQFSVVSVDERLSYERSPSADPSSKEEAQGTTSEPIKLAGRVESNLRLSEQLQTPENWERHVRGLEMLHSANSDRFAAINGFGVGRVIPPQVYLREVPSTETIPVIPAGQELPEEGPSYSTDDAGRTIREDESLQYDESNSPQKIPALDLVKLHRSGSDDFLNRMRFGFLNADRQAVGFQSHGFSQRAQLPETHRSQWLVSRMELVSLLRFETPRVYLSSDLPDMENLKDVPTRELESFEESGLDELRTQQDVIVEIEPDRIRMLGSLRAGEQCLDCHSVRRGTLLGAFSYVLRPSVQ